MMNLILSIPDNIGLLIVGVIWALATGLLIQTMNNFVKTRKNLENPIDNQ